MRMAIREGSLADLATDSVISPDSMASRGITVPFTRVASTSFASTFVPAGVFPATTLWRRVTGNSQAPAQPDRAGVCWLNSPVELRIIANAVKPAAIVLLNIFAASLLEEPQERTGRPQKYNSASEPTKGDCLSWSPCALAHSVKMIGAV